MKVNLILESNCLEVDSKCTLWIIKGNYDPDDEEAPDRYQDDLRAFRVVGPIATELAQEIRDNLLQFFTKIGCEVALHGAADD